MGQIKIITNKQKNKKKCINCVVVLLSHLVWMVLEGRYFIVPRFAVTMATQSKSRAQILSILCETQDEKGCLQNNNA